MFMIPLVGHSIGQEARSVKKSLNESEIRRQRIPVRKWMQQPQRRAAVPSPMNRSLILAAVFMLSLASAARGQAVEELWNKCANCHGQNGKGGGAGTRTLLTEELANQEHDRPFFDAIKNGLETKGMPPFGATMKDAQI